MNKILTLSILTAATVVGMIADASPAMAQGARFQFEPNKWANKDGGGKPGRYLNQPQVPMTSVGHGMVPKASSFLGVDPSFLKPAPKPVAPAPVVATDVHPSASWGQPQARIVPKAPQALAATPYNPAFGAAPTNKPPAPVIAQAPAAPQITPPSASSSRSLSGRMVPPRHSHAKAAVAGRLMTPKRPTAMAATPQVASYGGQFFKSGSTKPSASFNSEGNVYGQIIHK